MREKTAERLAAVAFATSAVSSIALGITYWVGGHTQFEGAFLAGALGGLALGLALWAKRIGAGADEAQATFHVGPRPRLVRALVQVQRGAHRHRG